MSNISFYSKNCSPLLENTQGVLIKITSGQVKGMTENIGKCPSINSQKERGSIILNKNLNRIEIEGISFENYGYFKTHSIILDPPKPPHKCVCCCNCSSKKKCKCPLTPVESGIMKSVNLFVPPGVSSFIIYTRAFQNWRYGCNLNSKEPSQPIETINCHASYQSIYRFAWYVNIIKKTNNIYPIYAIGPHINFEQENEQCVAIKSNITTTNVIQNSEFTSTDNLIANNSPMDDIQGDACCEVETEDGSTTEGVCVQPFYNNLQLNEYSIFGHSSLVEGAYAAGSNRESANAELGLMFNSTPFLMNNPTSINTLNLGLTTSACFTIVNCEKQESNENQDTGNLLNLQKSNIYGVLTLFTNNC